MSGFGLMLGGSLLSGLGGLMGGIGRGRAGRQARDWYNSQTSSGMNRLGMLMYGPDAWINYLGGTYEHQGQLWPAALEGKLADMTKPADMTDEQWAAEQDRLGKLADQWRAMQGFVNAQGGPIIGQLRGLRDTARQGSHYILNQYDQGTNRLLGASGQLASQMSQLFGRNTQQLSGLATGAENMAKQYGQGMLDIADQDFNRSAKSIGDQTMAMLRASGLASSTAGAGALSRALAQNEQERARAKTNIQAATTDRVLGARSQRLGMLGQQFGQQQGIMNQIGGSEVSMLANRLAGRTGLMRQNQQLDLNLAQLPINTMLGVTQGSVMNPWLGQNTSQYYPGNAAMGLSSAFGSIGNAMSGFGGYMYGQDMANQRFQQYLAAMGAGA